jgi:outer membrane receptor protein involved in Fe transport
MSMLVSNDGRVAVVLACALLALLAGTTSAQAQAQDPFAGGDDDLDPGAESAGEPSAPAAESAPAETPAEEPVASEPEAEPAAATDADVSASASGSVDLNVPGSAVGGADAASSARATAADAAAGEAEPAVYTGSHIRRQPHHVEGALVLDSPLRTDVTGREYLQLRRQYTTNVGPGGGFALPDTTAALELGMPGTNYHALRGQPTLILLNGRRLIAMPYFGPRGTDVVDINQIPIPLVERIESTYGIAAGLYGEDAIGGVVNIITRRDFDAFEVEVGGQVTDSFDQHEADVSIVAGMGKKESGVTGTVSYFNRQPQAASDSNWIGARGDRTQSLLGFPATFQQFSNWDYPIADPLCQQDALGTQFPPGTYAASHWNSNGYEVRIKGYGPPNTFGQLNAMAQSRLLGNHDMARGSAFGTDDMVIGELETTTYCAQDYTPNQDLVLKDERIQGYVTAWHELTDHTEAFAELGYYRSENAQRTAPAFPILHTTTDLVEPRPVIVPGVQMPAASDQFDYQHADNPFLEPGFAGVETPSVNQRDPNNLFIVGRTHGPFHPAGENTRRVDVMRGVLGLQGDLKDAGQGGLLESWDWDVSGTYTTTESISRVQDTLVDKLADALMSCPRAKRHPQANDADMDGEVDFVPTTIKERQEMGCFNPFYSSVINSSVLDPLGVSGASPASEGGFVTTDSEDLPTDLGYGAQDGGYICDPDDPSSPACPFDPSLAGTVNTKQVIDRITGEHTTYARRTLALADAAIRGDLVEFSGGGLGFGLGAQFRRETLLIDYDQAYNQKLYGFLFGGPDVDPLERNVGMGYAELRLRALDGLIEVQPAISLEHYQKVGTGLNWMAGLAIRPFAASPAPPEALEWLLLRGHIGSAMRAPSLIQLEGTMNEFVTVDYRGATLFIPHQIGGNGELDFEKYTTISGGLQWDWAGLHVGADFWMTKIDDLIAADNARTLVDDCWETYQLGAPRCPELGLVPGPENLDHLKSEFDNLAKVDSNGIDGAVMYTLDSKRRGLGDFGTFVLGVQGSYLNSYLIDSPRGLRHFYREGEPAEQHNEDGDMLAHKTLEVVDNVRAPYSTLKATYEAAGYRNEENFAPPLPKLRFSVPVRYSIEAHTLGVTLRYTGGYNDDSENTIEERNLPGIDQIQFAEGEAIPAWMVFDASYGFWFGDDDWKVRIAVGVLNIADEAPPAVHAPLGYEPGLHDPRGRTIYARVTGEM